ncbi:hypothetical protein SAMN05660485_02142 [Blastococcus fimeti]|nr:hypothetical protein SAMN05660485_02142 [Blastococcus fimeti]
MARSLVSDAEALRTRGWRMASPVWFPLLWTSMTVLASVPAALLLDGANAAGWYWAVMAPVSAVVSGWFFSTRRAQPPVRVGLVVLATGLAMLLASGAIVWLADGSWDMAPWLVVGAGFAVFAAAWRSASTAVFAAATLGTAVTVSLVDPDDRYLVVALVVGVVGALAALAELVRADPERRA